MNPFTLFPLLFKLPLICGGLIAVSVAGLALLNTISNAGRSAVIVDYQQQEQVDTRKNYDRINDVDRELAEVAGEQQSAARELEQEFRKLPGAKSTPECSLDSLLPLPSS